jgi:acyl-CoA synthetase (AMP-forming)/AMP-acid ligase II
LERIESDPSTLSELLARRAASERHRLAFAAGKQTLSYAELAEEAHVLAGGLVHAGVQPGDRVAIHLPAGLDFVRMFWAIQHLGATACALNPFTPPAQAMRRAALVRPALIVTADDGVLAAAATAGLRAVALHALSRAPVTLPSNATSGDDIAILQTTSGTSGEPRAAMIRHRNTITSIRGAITALGFGPDDVLAAWVPPWHDLGLIRFVVGTVYFSAVCHIVSPAIQTIPEWFSMMASVRATITGAPDFAYRLATRIVPRGLDLSSLQDLTNGGEPVRLSTIQAFEERFGLAGKMRPGYGLAEATLGVTCTVEGEPLRVDERGNVSCGRVLPEVELRIADDGEILVRGPLVFAGYFEAEELNREILRDGWLHTGDVGHLDGDGHLFVLGRKRALLKRGGAALAPRELEEAAQQVPGVRLAAAVGLPPKSESSTEEIVVAIETDPDVAPGEVVRAVSDAVLRALGFAPEQVVILAPRTLPRTWNGKIRHAALRDALADGTLAGQNAILYSGR